MFTTPTIAPAILAAALGQDRRIWCQTSSKAARRVLIADAVPLDGETGR